MLSISFPSTLRKIITFSSSETHTSYSARGIVGVSAPVTSVILLAVNPLLRVASGVRDRRCIWKRPTFLILGSLIVYLSFILQCPRSAVKPCRQVFRKTSYFARRLGASLI